LCSLYLTSADALNSYKRSLLLLW